jgi:hypothetical protein
MKRPAVFLTNFDKNGFCNIEAYFRSKIKFVKLMEL